MTAYKKIIESREYRRYKEALADPVFQDFLKFRESDEFQKINSFKERFRNALYRKYYSLYNSSYYKNYMKMLNSSELKQLAALEQEINTPDFQKRHELWADAKRWQHSE